MNYHIKRWITGLLATPLLFAFVFYSSEKVFSVFVILVIQIAVWEYITLVFDQNGFAWEKGEVFIFSLIISLSFYLKDISYTTPVITLSLFLTFLLFLLEIGEEKVDVFKTGKVIIGFMYMPIFMSHFMLLRQLDKGVSWIYLTIVITFCADCMGFYIGRTFGKRKLHPFVSPGKTVEGTVGMICGSLLGSLIFQQLFFQELPFPHAIVLGLLGGIVGQLGDLFESAIKRTVGAKDAGIIFPGHGGMLDRLDSLCFIAPFIFYYHRFVIR